MLTIIEAAESYIGVRDAAHGGGAGVRDGNALVAKWLAAVGCAPPDNWCAAFVVGMCDEAMVPVPHIPGALRLRDALVNAGHDNGMTPQPGWLYFIDHGHGLGHVGIVESFDGEVVEEISGNTLDVTSRTGGTVARNHWRLDFARSGMPVHSGRLVGFVNPAAAREHT